MATYLSDKTGFPVEVEQVSLRWFDALTLGGLKVYDQQDSLMISVDEAFVDFRLLNLIDSRQPSLDEVVLDHPKVQLIKNTPERGLNINAFIKNLRQLLPERNKSTKTYVPFLIGEISVHEGTFSYHDPYKDSLEEIFDYNHMDLRHINGQLEDFRIIADTIEFDVQALEALAPRYDFSVKELQTFFRFTERSMLFDQLALKAGESTIRDSLSFNYNSIEALEYFVDSVQIKAKLDNAVVHAKDLAVFAPYFKQFEDTYYLSGRFDGSISDFETEDIHVRLGDSYFKGAVSMDGLPDFNETFIEAELLDSRLKPEDFAPYFSTFLYDNIRKFGTTSFNGQFLGFPTDFVANGTFDTGLGHIRSDINLKLNTQNQDLSTYSGALALHNFKLARFLEEPSLKQISMQGKVDGSGFSLASARLNLDANIFQIGYNDYNYRNIRTKGKLARSFFEGDLAIKDPNLQVEGKGSIDFRNQQQKIKVSARLDTAFLQPLKLSEKEAFFSANVDINISGVDIDEIQGEMYLADAYIQYNQRDLSLDTLSFFSAIDENGRQLMVETDKVDLYASGDFDYTTLAKDVERLYKEYAMNFRNQSEEIDNYYQEKEAPEDYQKYRLDYVAKLKDVNPVLQLLVPELSISANTEVQGSFSGGYTSILSANTFIDTLQYRDDIFYQLQAEVNTSKIADSTNVLAMAFLHSATQEIKGFTSTEDLILEAIWDRDHIELSGELQQQDSDNFIDLQAGIFFQEDQTALRFEQSDLHLLENTWKISKDNRILLKDGNVYFENFEIKDRDQFILAEGVLSEDPSRVLDIQVNNFQLANLNPILDQQLAGAVNGYVAVQNVFKTPVLDGQLKATDLKVDKFLVGDLLLDTRWNPEAEHLDVNIDAMRMGNHILTAEGYYNPFQEENNLHIDAILNKTNLSVIEPFVDDIFSEIKGTASGKVLITGTPLHPILRGGGSVNNGHIKINYLNTAYTFEGGFIFSENEIGFRKLQVLDTDGNPAVVDGGIFHDGFTNFIINIEAELMGTMVLNTTYHDNELYYGTAYAVGELEVLGPINNLNFIANARSAKGTKMYIPIDFGVDLVQEDFIHFVSQQDTLAHQEASMDVGVSGIKLDFDLEITPDAYVEIIFDLRAGDIIRGRGNGKLSLQIDTEGEFNMFGTYEILQGAYNFTLFNVITKEFVIDPGSTIRWDGDPYGGTLNILASYHQSASLLPVLNSAEGNKDNSLARRPYPVVVLMDLEGDLLSPSIAFDIEVQDYPNIYFPEIQRFESLLANDEQFLNRQVFNLIVLRQFAPSYGQYHQNAFGLGSQTAVSSISELLSNQFSALATQIDENLEIDLDVSSSLDEDAINTFQLRLSYTLLDGRLRITRDGSIYSKAEQQGVSNLIGDWTVEYLLTPDGQYKIKMYSRNNFNQLTNTIYLDSYTQGVSLSQTKRFDSLKELFQKQKKKQPLKQPDFPIQDNSDEGLLKEEEKVSSENL
uniref:translocation/assembly module TamB domain-containing protein n=1 Tax=Nafulsella turpanensis TaxID=1265690 RepID=UPI001F388A9F|nr:translocation/assembly module TamB domain-containing protein [Nafulsella turpanensis]